jgi:TMEM175 potassium channel family protein
MTGWVGEHPTKPVPTALYGVVFVFAAIAYTILQNLIIKADGGSDSLLARAVEHDWKGKLSIVLYLAGIASAFFRPWLGQAFYVVVAIVWLVPDRRIEKRLAQNS